MPDEVMVNFLLGHNDYNDPAVLPQGAYARGVNVSSRGGIIKTRPRLKAVTELPDGLYQGEFTTRGFTVFVISGSVYRFRHNSATYSEVTEVSRAPYATRCWGCDVEGTAFINDGANKPVIVGLNTARELGEGEIPAGTVCAYGQRRIFYADRFQRTLSAGDIALDYDPENVWKNTEQQVLNEGLYIKQPTSSGPIRGLGFVRNYQTGSGLGQLVEISENAVNAYNVYLPRSQWLSGDSQLGQQLFTLQGAGGSPAMVKTNNDLFFRAGDAVRTLRSTVSEASSGISNKPMSQAADGVLTRDHSGSLEFISGALLNNRLLYTTGARVDPYDGTRYFDSIISFDLASYSTGSEAQFTCDGVWVGHKFLSVFSADGKMYAVVRGDDGANILCVFDEAEIADYDGAPVVSRVYTPRFVFGDAFHVKKFVYADAFLSKIACDTTLQLYYRGDNELWTPCSERSINVGTYADETAHTLDVYKQNRRRVRISPTGSKEGDPVSLSLLDRGTTFQFCVEFTGVCQVDRILFNCEPPQNGGESVCGDFDTTQLTAEDDAREALYDYGAIDGD